MGKLNKIVCFDFDNTLCMKAGDPNHEMIEKVKKYHEQGYRCYIVTARNKAHEATRWIQNNEPNRIRVKDFIKDHQLPIKQCHFLNHQPKGPVLKRIGAFKHYDDELEQIESAKEYGIQAILVCANKL
jgi:hypothetical protein